MRLAKPGLPGLVGLALGEQSGVEDLGLLYLLIILWLGFVLK